MKRTYYFILLVLLFFIKNGNAMQLEDEMIIKKQPTFISANTFFYAVPRGFVRDCTAFHIVCGYCCVYIGSCILQTGGDPCIGVKCACVGSVVAGASLACGSIYFEEYAEKCS